MTCREHVDTSPRSGVSMPIRRPVRTNAISGGYARRQRTLTQLLSVIGHGRHVLPAQTRRRQGLARVTVTSIDRRRSVLTESCRKITR
jgi:hypothetical protein